MSDIDGLKNYERRWLHRRVIISEDRPPHAGRVGRVTNITRKLLGSAMVDYVRVALDDGPLLHLTTYDIELYPEHP